MREGVQAMAAIYCFIINLVILYHSIDTDFIIEMVFPIVLACFYALSAYDLLQSGSRVYTIIFGILLGLGTTIYLMPVKWISMAYLGVLTLVMVVHTVGSHESKIESENKPGESEEERITKAFREYQERGEYITYRELAKKLGISYSKVQRTLKKL